MRVELLNGKSVDERVRLVATAGLLSRNNGNVFDVYSKRDNYEKNLKVVKQILSYGHESIIEHDYLVFAISDVSPIIEQILIGQRLASFTIKSRREVDFSKVGFYKPDFSYLSNGDEISNDYVNHMDYLFNEYNKLLNMGIPKEDARFVLPYSYHSNIIMGIDCRSLKKLIDYCINGKMSILPEVKEFGNKLVSIVLNYVPYLEEQLNNEEKRNIDPFLFMDEKVSDKSYKILDKTTLLECSNNIDDTIIISCIMNRYQVDINRALSIYSKLTKEDKINIMNTICTNKEQRELEQVTFRYQIPVSLAVLTHLTRHRMHSLLIPDFIPIGDLKQHIVPPTIRKRCLDTYEDIYKKNYKMYQSFKNNKVEEKDLVYFHLSGNMVNVITNMNGRTLEWISRMRCCNKAQWEVRNIANDMVNLAKKEAPLFGNYLGATCDVFKTCPEGKESCGKVYSLKKINNNKR